MKFPHEMNNKEIARFPHGFKMQDEHVQSVKNNLNSRWRRRNLRAAQELGLILESSLPLLSVLGTAIRDFWRSWVLPRNWA